MIQTVIVDGPLRRGQLRIEARSDLNAEERSALLALPGSIETVGARRDFVRLYGKVQHSSLIVSGVAARFAQLDDGSRQTIGFYLPGDMVDLYSMLLPHAQSGLQALTRCTILKVPHDVLRMLSKAHPNIASALWRDCAADAQVIAQWLVNIGRRDARARTAHLLCELAVRYAQAGLLVGDSFPFTITQEHLADALGLTAVHVNRTLKTLREMGLIRLAQREAVILDWFGLMRAAEFDPNYLSVPFPASSLTELAKLA